MAVLIVAGGGFAQANAVGEAGGQAAAQAQGAYHADATGAMDAADENQQSAREQAADQVRHSGNAYESAEADAYSQANVSPPDRPECQCKDTIGQVEEQGHGQFQTAEHAEQSADLENEYVDAGADVEASGQAQGWYDQLFDGVTDAFDKVQSALEMDTDVDEDAEAHVDQSLETDDQLREKAAATLEQEQHLPAADPGTQGSLGAQHATSAATSTVTQAGGSAP